MAPEAIAGVDPCGHTDAREQWPIWINRIELKAHRQTLDDLDPIAGRILGRQHCEIGASAGAHADDVRPERAVRIGIDVDRRLLAWTHMGQARLAEIRLDPDAPARQQREHGRPWIDEIADLEVVDPRHNAVLGRRHRRIGEIELGSVELGLGRAHRRVVLDLDIRVAVQGDHGVGDLLFDRCDVLAGDLESRLGLVIDLTRGEVVGNQRFLAVKLALIVSGGILGRL